MTLRMRNTAVRLSIRLAQHEYSVTVLHTHMHRCLIMKVIHLSPREPNSMTLRMHNTAIFESDWASGLRGVVIVLQSCTHTRTDAQAA